MIPIDIPQSLHSRPKKDSIPGSDRHSDRPSKHHIPRRDTTTTANMNGNTHPTKKAVHFGAGNIGMSMPISPIISPFSLVPPEPNVLDQAEASSPASFTTRGTRSSSPTSTAPSSTSSTRSQATRSSRSARTAPRSRSSPDTGPSTRAPTRMMSCGRLPRPTS